MSNVCPSLRWDVFCRVIDNLGDIGVCWRLCRGLANRGQQVRFWIDQAQALQWMAPGAQEGGWPGIEVMSWDAKWPSERHAQLPRSDVWVEAFGCEPPHEFIRQQRGLWSATEQPVWINLEYLSAEPYVERMHRLPSPLMAGPAEGWTRWFFYPGFTPATGGLLRENALWTRQQTFDWAAWRKSNLAAAEQASDGWISLFCYEPEGLPWLLKQLQEQPSKSLLVAPGRPAAAVQTWLAMQSHGNKPPPQWHFRPWVDPDSFDEMLWACDLNFVRGEDSLVRALWAGQAFIWQIYPQADQAHHAKLEAFLAWLEAPSDLQDFHRFWNGMNHSAPPELSAARIDRWKQVVQQARLRLQQQPDLISQLFEWVAEKR